MPSNKRKMNPILFWELMSFWSIIIMTALFCFLFTIKLAYGLFAVVLTLLLIGVSVAAFQYCISKRDKELEDKWNKEKQKLISRTTVDSNQSSLYNNNVIKKGRKDAKMVNYDPAVEADAYYQRQEASWVMKREESTCADCANCIRHDTIRQVAFCTDFNEFIDPDERPGVYGIECDRFRVW